MRVLKVVLLDNWSVTEVSCCVQIQVCCLMPIFVFQKKKPVTLTCILTSRVCLLSDS